MIAYRPCYAGSHVQPLPWRRVGRVGSRLKRPAPSRSEPSENSSKLLDVDVLIVPHLYAVRQTQFLGNPGGRVQSKRSSRPTPAAPRPAAPQPAPERGSAPPRREGAVVFPTLGFETVMSWRSTATDRSGIVRALT